jgi:hypothetical protein
MADNSPIPDTPNFSDAQILMDQIQRNQRHLEKRQAPEVIPEAAGGARVPQEAVGGVGARENVTENPRGDLNMAG